MSAGIETSIWLALKSRIESLPLNYPKALPGQIKFEPPSLNGKLLPFIRVGKVSVAPADPYIDDGNPSWRYGALILALVYPFGQELEVYEHLASKIATHFAQGTEMEYGELTVVSRSTPHVQDGYEDNGYWAVPVRIPWRCYA